jgi:hypothetical protein
MTARRVPLAVVTFNNETTTVPEGSVMRVGAADNNARLGAATPGIGSGLIGLAFNAATAAGPLDIVTDGIFPGVAGGTITRGDPLTSDAAGAVVTAAPGAGTNYACIGHALASAVAGDRVPVQISRFILQG